MDYSDETEPVYQKPNTDLYSMVSYNKTMELHQTVWNRLAEWRDMVGFYRSIGDRYVLGVETDDDLDCETESNDSGLEHEAAALKIDGSL